MTKTNARVKVTLTHERDTKGTRVFKTDDEDAAITQLYIRKPYANDLPDKIVVTVEKSSQ